MENFFIKTYFDFIKTLKSRTASYFLTLFTIFSRNDTNVNKSTINHKTNFVWFIENNRQKISKLILQEIELAMKRQIQQCFLLLKKQKKPN